MGELPYSMGVSQRDRMSIEHEYMERMKIYKRRREIIQHREPVDLLLGGEKVSYSERYVNFTFLICNKFEETIISHSYMLRIILFC